MNAIENAIDVQNLSVGYGSKVLLQMLILTFPNVEGLCFPDTYVFDPDDADIAIYRRASQA
ncbi:MAG: hypothetical protein B7Y67_17455, partial [Polynucleobacter sp. 35-46-11]